MRIVTMRIVRHCEFCGDDLGGAVEKYPHDDLVTCGKRECERAAREDSAAARSEARCRAEEDDYEHYR